MSENFPEYTREDWEALAVEATPDKKAKFLNEVINNEIEIKAVYSQEENNLYEHREMPGTAPYTRGTKFAARENGVWDIRAIVSSTDIESANKNALDELKKGSTSLLVDYENIGIRSFEDLETVLENIYLEMIGVCLKPGQNGLQIASWLIELWEKRKVELRKRQGSLGLDPLGVAAIRGNPVESFEDCIDFENLMDRAGYARVIAVDSSIYAESGANAVEELSYSMSTAVSYLRDLTDMGLNLETVLRNISFTYSCNADQFTTIAKFRAARSLWSRITQECGASLESQVQLQHAITPTSRSIKTDPWSVLLRGTVATFAAGVGGAEAITVLPFDGDTGQSEEFGRRIARNTQLLLTEESHVGRVIDPAGGSWYVEELTDQLVQKTWSHFQNLESLGGMQKVIESGYINKGLKHE